jgi:hypothetical protein
MIHYLYVGHFAQADNAIRMEKRADGAPHPVVVRPLDAAVLHDLLGEQGGNVPADWPLWIDKDGFIVCHAYSDHSAALDFVRTLAKRTGCDVFLDRILLVPVDELETRGLMNGAKAIRAANQRTPLSS